MSIAYSSEGCIEFDPETGCVTAVHDDTGERSWLHDIDKIDVDTYHAVHGDMPDQIDILCLGYWTTDGVYCKAEV